MPARFFPFVLLLAGLVGCSGSVRPDSSRPVASSHVAPRATSASVELAGRPFDLWNGRENAKATVLVFTRSDCPISNRSAPALKALCESYQPLGIDFFLVYVDPKEDAASIERHQKEFGYICPGLHDPSHKLVAQCQATVTPEAVVFDREQTIVYQGRIDDLYISLGQSRPEPTTHELADALEAMVTNRPVAQPRTRAVGCYIGDLSDHD